MSIDLAGRSWADRTPRDMTEAELEDAISAYEATGDERDQITAGELAIELGTRYGIHPQ